MELPKSFKETVIRREQQRRQQQERTIYLERQEEERFQAMKKEWAKEEQHITEKKILAEKIFEWVSEIIKTQEYKTLSRNGVYPLRIYTKDTPDPDSLFISYIRLTGNGTLLYTAGFRVPGPSSTVEIKTPEKLVIELLKSDLEKIVEQLDSEKMYETMIRGY